MLKEEKFESLRKDCDVKSAILAAATTAIVAKGFVDVDTLRDYDQSLKHSQESVKKLIDFMKENEM